MEKTNHKKIIHGRTTDLYKIDTIKKKITPYGKGGAHITIPNVYLDAEAVVDVLIPKPFVCKGCTEVISKAPYFSPEKNLCDLCYRQKQAIDNNECLKCRGKNPKNDYWGVCQKCWDKSNAEADEYNRKQGKNAIMDWDAEPIKPKEAKSKQS